MALTITTRLEDGIGILELSGALTAGPSLAGLRASAKQLIAGNKLSGLIVHVGDVSRTDTMGLGELTAIYTLATKRCCPLRLVDVKAQLRKVLALTHLDELLPSSADIASAKNEMKGPRASSSSA